MEVPVVKIRDGEAGAEEKTMIKSIVNMVQYSVYLFVWLSDKLMGTWKYCMSFNSHGVLIELQCMANSLMVN